LEKLKEKFLNFQYKGVIGVTLIFALIAVILFVERTGIQYNFEKSSIALLEEDKIITKEEAFANQKKTTLLVWNGTDSASISAYEQFKVIFKDMKVGYDALDVSKKTLPSLNKYDKAVILVSNLQDIGKEIVDLTDWVNEGGNVMFAMTLQKEAYFSVVESKLGIIECSYENALVDSIYVDGDFMIGGGRGFTIDDGYDSALSLQLSKENTKVHAWTDDARKLPLIWESKHGKGKFVVCNIGLYEKVMRGFYASAFTLLDDVSVYPVVNGSVFYLDDFPSQIPSGNSTYIQRDYQTTIRDFYVNIWWPNMMNFADKYGIRYTGLAIECYDDAVDGATDALPDEGTFLNFGNMLMRQGGEIGYHGYNHQPLCLGNVDYKGQFDYKTWESTDAMKKAFDSLVDLCDELFPDVDIQVYVPPSNILSPEGREFLLKEYPQIKTISGIYFEDADVDASCVQEFEVSENGVVDQPRVVSACKLEPFMELAVISELNFHFLNSHFTHPDDALDPERGAELGWEKLKFHFNEYLNWVYSSAPMIRNFTGTEMSAAVQRFSAIGFTQKLTDNEMTLNVKNLYDEAYLMIRFNSKSPDKVTGGEISHVTGNLYLLKVTDENVKISLNDRH